MSGPEVSILSSTASLTDVAESAIYAAIGAALKERPSCSVVLAGGNTPRSVYQALVAHDAPKRRRRLPSVEFFFGDERCVPPDHPDSNYKMAREALGPDANIHRIEAEKPDRDAAAREYERILPKVLDVVILGIGEDGHTASLFPGSPAVSELARRVVSVKGAPKPPPERITLTPASIESAHLIVMIASGAGKAAAVQRALEGAWNPRETPAQIARRGMWVLDDAAASRLATKSRKP